MFKITDPDFGVLYVATGEKYRKEVLRSVSSLKEIMPDIKTALFVDDPSGIPVDFFDYIRVIADPTYSVFDKIDPILNTPFEKTLYLDTDTLILEPFYELGDLLDRFELAYCHAPYRYHSSDNPGCNAAFVQGNAGLILYKSTKSTFELFQSWITLFNDEYEIRKESAGPMTDQPSFRKAVYDASVIFTILPPEYNLRTPFPYFVGRHGKVKILHGREPSLSWVKNSLRPGVRSQIGYNLSRAKMRVRLAWKLFHALKRG